LAPYPEDQEPFEEESVPADEEADAGAAENPFGPPIDLTIPLDREDREKLARRLCVELSRYWEGTQRKRDLVAEHRRAWECYPTGRANRWGEGTSADIPADHVRGACNSHTIRLNAQITRNTPPFNGRARKQAALDLVPVFDEAMASILEEADWEGTAVEAHIELPVGGNLLWCTTYEEEWERRPKRSVKWEDEEHAALLAAGANPLDAQFAAAKGVEFHHEDVLAYRGIKFRIIPFEDMIVAPLTARKPRDLYLIGERLTISGAELKEGVRRKKYLPEAVEKLLDLPSDPVNEDRQIRAEYQGMDLYNGSAGGYIGGDEEEDEDYKEFEVCEFYFLYDGDGDGKREWVRVGLHENSQTIFRLQWHDYQHGKPPYVWFRHMVRPGELWGMSVPELIASYQDGATATQCQLVDAGDLILALGTTLLHSGTTKFDPNKFQAKIGGLIEVEDVNDFKPLPSLHFPVEQRQLLADFRESVERLTGASNPVQGRETSGDKTLGEVQIMFSQANMIFEDQASGVARSHAEVWDQVRHLVAQFGMGDDGMVEYRKTASPETTEFAQIPPSVLKADIDMVPVGLQQLGDSQSQFQQAVMLNTMFMPQMLQEGNIEAQEIIQDEILLRMRSPVRRKLMAAIKRGNQLKMQMQMAAMQGQMDAAAAMQGGAPPVEGGQPALPPGPAEGAPPPVGPDVGVSINTESPFAGDMGGGLAL
jgi:hypothetical protein